MRNLVLHCGHQKTGTTTLQRIFVAADAACDDFLYPEAGRGPALQHRDLSRVMRKKSGRRVWDRLRDEIRASGAGTIVLSSETLHDTPPDRVAEGLGQITEGGDFDPRVVIYVRPHGSRILSAYAQRAKLGLYRGSVGDFVGHVCAAGLFRFADGLGAWKRQFGDRLFLLPFDRAHLAGGDIVEDFAGRFLPGLRDEIVAIGRATDTRNRSPNLKVLAMMRLAADALLPGGDKAMLPLLKAAEEIYADCPSRPGFGPGDIAAIRAAFATDAAALDALTGGSVFADDLARLDDRLDASGDSARPPEDLLGPDSAIHKAHFEALRRVLRKTAGDGEEE